MNRSRFLSTVWEGAIRPLDCREGGAQMDSDTTRGGFRGQRISRTLEQIRTGCPGCVYETKTGGDGTLSENNEE